MHKVPREYRFLDLSDYARPLAILLAKLLKDTFLRAIHITLIYFLVGLLAVWQILQGNFVASAILIQVKNLLDAVDGTLARLQNRPSKLGRFADSLADIVLNFLFILAIAIHYDCCYILALLSFLSVSIQGSFFNYYYVKYRHKFGGDTTSKLKEDKQAYPWDDPRMVEILFMLYRVLYGWQDRFVEFVDGLIFGKCKIHRNRLFMTSITLFGLGIHLLLLSLVLLVGKPLWFLYISLYMNLILAMILIGFRVSACS